MIQGRLKLSADCMECVIRRQMESAVRIESEQKRAEYMQQVLLAIANANLDEPAPVALEKINALHREYLNEDYTFDELKKFYNKMMLEREESLRSIINSSKNRLETAMKYSRVGNYIDFGALGSVNDEKLEEMLMGAEDEKLDESVYKKFVDELATAKRLVFLTDNCGEIVLDKLLLEVIKDIYPDIYITVIVRGLPILNDATTEDAEMIGISKQFRVVGNGNRIAGTFYSRLSEEARSCIDTADLILAKGQANYETLNGCGLNVYYLFLCKCSWFMRQFGLEQFAGVFINENK